MTMGVLGSAGVNIDRAASFPDTGSFDYKYLILSSANFGAFNASKFAISVWFYRDMPTISNNSNICCFGDRNNPSDYAIKTGFNASTNEPLNVDLASSGTAYFTRGTREFNKIDRVWHHVYVEFDGSLTQINRFKMWIDGTAETLSGSGPTFTSVNSPATPFIVGASQNASAGSDGFFGLLYQFAFFSGTLPGVSAVYRSGPVDVRGVAGIKSLLPFSSSVGSDFYLPTAWTNNNGVTTSTNIPT